MKRFFNDEPEDNPLFENSFEDDEAEYEMEDMLLPPHMNEEIINVISVDLAQLELSSHLLSKSIEIAQQSWTWRFRSNSYKMKEIAFIYKELHNIVLEYEEEEEEEDG